MTYDPTKKGCFISRASHNINNVCLIHYERGFIKLYINNVCNVCLIHYESGLIKLYHIWDTFCYLTYEPI